jgi:glycosyltransferase involved in cell wall biosynthesis
LIQVVLAVTNDIVTDNRLHKIANTLINNGYRVTIAGRKFSYSQNLFSRPYKTRRFKLWFNRGFVFYANYNIRLFFYLLRVPVDIVVANDLDTLAACWFAAKLRRKVLIFDSHELFTEVPELVDRSFVKKIWSINEWLFIKGVNFCYTVSNPIQGYYKERYKKDFLLIRNVGMFRFENNNKSGDGQKIIIYQGAVNKGRGLELMLEAMHYLKEYVLWIIGNGDILNELKQMAIRLKIEDKVVFTGRVSLDSLPEFTLKAHIGISLEEDLGLNYRYALPNKLFDYIQARIPVVVSNLPEMKNLVEQYQVGKVLDGREPHKLSLLIQELIEDEKNTARVKKNLELAARELCWQREEDKVISLYRKASEQVQLHNA